MSLRGAFAPKELPALKHGTIMNRECKKRKRKITNSLEGVVNIFHKKYAHVESFDQLFYRHSVDSNYKPCKEGKAAWLFRIYSEVSFDGNIYIYM